MRNDAVRLCEAEHQKRRIGLCGFVGRSTSIMRSLTRSEREGLVARGVHPSFDNMQSVREKFDPTFGSTSISAIRLIGWANEEFHFCMLMLRLELLVGLADVQ